MLRHALQQTLRYQDVFMYILFSELCELVWDATVAAVSVVACAVVRALVCAVVCTLVHATVTMWYTLQSRYAARCSGEIFDVVSDVV